MSDLINDRGHDEICNAIGGANGDGRDLGKIAEPKSALVPTEAPETEHVSGLRSAWCGGFDPANADDLASEHFDPEAILIAAEGDDVEAAVCAVRGDQMMTAWRSYPQPSEARQTA